jgi:uncharacterized protein
MNTALHPLQNLDGHINTFSGKVNLLDPQPEHIVILDIAWSLSAKPHFGGFCRPWLSIAQHSELVFLLADFNHEEIEILKAALMHDAAEAYLSDIVKPLKVQPEFKFYCELEKKWMEVIADKFGIDKEALKYIKKYDLHAQQLEYDRFFKGSRDLDLWIGNYYGPEAANQSFLVWFELLFGKEAIK